MSPRPADAVRRKRDHKRRAGDVDHELDHVQQVDDARRAEPVDGPVLDDRLQSAEEGLPPPFREIERRRFGLDEPHVASGGNLHLVSVIA